MKINLLFTTKGMIAQCISSLVALRMLTCMCLPTATYPHRYSHASKASVVTIHHTHLQVWLGKIMAGGHQKEELAAVKVAICAEEQNRLRNEGKRLMQLNHQGVIRFLGYMYPSNTSEALILEYCPCGALAQHLQGPRHNPVQQDCEAQWCGSHSGFSATDSGTLLVSLEQAILHCDSECWCRCAGTLWHTSSPVP